ncbi:Hypothetical predicted protein [Paramuricea clavata]|uniref:Uncharacterized protein n=1 Tax=Paramuricea clavata TaxID=317549 RepID=A0A6S7JH87_PARCT|nr:Hypothetical predicted protein [Paramuricea clavata]
MGTESDEEIFEAVREVEEAAKVPQKKARKTKSTADKSQTEHKRDKLIELSRDGIIEKSASFIRKSNKDVVDRLYHEYESQRMSCASDFLSTLIISKFASVLGSFGAVKSSEKLMSNYGEPYEWGNAWEGTEFESIIDELIEKTDKNKEQLDKIQATLDSLESDHSALKNKIVGPPKYDFEAFKNDTIKTVVNVYKKLHETQ